MTDLSLYDIDVQINCVEREIGMRKGVYARRVAEGKMRQLRATQEIECMQAVLETLKRVKDGE